MIQTNLEINSTEQDRQEYRQESRRYPRLDIDLGALIEFSVENEDFQPSYKGLIVDSSLGGCGIVTVSRDFKLFQANKIFYIKISDENNTALKTKIIWFKKIDNNVFRLGLEYID
ncbi:MAG: PilZ domain-containing protein [Xenococcus sp. (in: cyanobacteria)]